MALDSRDKQDIERAIDMAKLVYGEQANCEAVAQMLVVVRLGRIERAIDGIGTT